MYTEVDRCRICGNPELVSILSLGRQYLTGVFPKTQHSSTAPLTSGPLDLVKCKDRPSSPHCGLVQLRQSYDLSEMYGLNYGYRSGLNNSMVKHLGDRVNQLVRRVDLIKGDLVLDIGSNDATLLKSYPDLALDRVGMDPTGIKFKDFYTPDIRLIPEFFSADSFRSHTGNRRAKVVTSIAMFYDLENPMQFMREVRAILAQNGVWCFEQSYLPAMLSANAYDTICHEHLEYYGLKQIKWMTDRVGLKIVDLELNQVNGGSFAVTVARDDSDYPEAAKVGLVLRNEDAPGISGNEQLTAFRENVFRHRDALLSYIKETARSGQKLFGYGASTKGNVILQFCELGPKEIPYVAEVNPDKFGALTPGSWIPIVSESEAKQMKPDIFLVLPWHFRTNLLEREQGWLKSGGKMCFPLPTLGVVSLQ